MISREAVLLEARRWVGVRWEHQGRNQHGIDCAGLVVMVCRALGISEFDVAAYPRDPVGGRFLHLFLGDCLGGARIAIGSAQPGDLLIFREQRWACHVGFVARRAGIDTLIHGHATHRKVLEEPLVGEWLTKRLAAVQLPGVG